MRFFEDMKIGDKVEIGRHTFTADEIKTFALKFDPQPFHIDEDAAARTHYGALCASGWHTAATWMKFCARQREKEDEAQRARGEPVGPRGPSSGFRELKWPKPVYVGDTIVYRTEIVDMRSLRTKPNWGLVFSNNTGTNQNGDLVLSFQSSVFVGRRTPG